MLRENQEIKQYLIDFVEKTLNECESFTKVYGKDFVRKRLEINLEKVYTDISSSNANTGLYDMENSCITIFSSNNSTKPLTIADIESNKKLQHMILHESIHVIFRRIKEECLAFGIEDGTGMLEFYNNGQELGRGFNEGLTEWICQKAGYGEQSYESEKNIIKILELAIGEDAVMQLAKGDVRGNVAQLLKMNKVECLKTIALVDDIHQNEKRVSTIDQMDLDNEDSQLDKSIAHLEANLFEKYFKDEIEAAQNTENISEETIQRLFDLNFCINGGKTPESKIFDSRLPLKFKNEIYPGLLKKQQETLIAQRREGRLEQEKIDLPVVYKKSWFKRLKETIKKKFTKESNQDVKYNILPNQEKKANQQQFKEYISDMSNYSGESVENIHTKQLQEQSKLKDTNELDLS
ncbi:MAG: hypothetical protein ACLU8F_03340 [Clostridia bacterium]